MIICPTTFHPSKKGVNVKKILADTLNFTLKSNKMTNIKRVESKQFHLHIVQFQDTISCNINVNSHLS